MCEFCVKHGEGKKWYLEAKNYAEDLLSDLRRREYISGFEPDHEVPANAPLRKPGQPRQGQRKSGGGNNSRGGAQTARGRGSEGHKRPRRRRSGTRAR